MTGDDDGIDFSSMKDREILILVARNQRDDHKRLNNHGKRLQKIEGIVLVGSVAFTAAGAGLLYAKELVISWAKKKIGATS